MIGRPAFARVLHLCLFLAAFNERFWIQRSSIFLNVLFLVLLCPRLRPQLGLIPIRRRPLVSFWLLAHVTIWPLGPLRLANLLEVKIIVVRFFSIFNTFFAAIRYGLVGMKSVVLIDFLLHLLNFHLQLLTIILRQILTFLEVWVRLAANDRVVKRQRLDSFMYRLRFWSVFLR